MRNSLVRKTKQSGLPPVAFKVSSPLMGSAETPASARRVPSSLCSSVGSPGPSDAMFSRESGVRCLWELLLRLQLCALFDLTIAQSKTCLGAAGLVCCGSGQCHNNYIATFIIQRLIQFNDFFGGEGGVTIKHRHNGQSSVHCYFHVIRTDS